MVGPILFLGLVATAAASGEVSLDEHHIQLEGVGALAAHLTGVMTPVRDAADGVPTFRFSSVAKGAPVPETEFYRCRCTVVDDLYVPLGARAVNRVLLCRSVSHEGSDAPLEEADRMAFLLYSDKLPPKVRKIRLLLGKAAYRNFLASHASPPTALRRDHPPAPAPEEGPFHSQLEYAAAPRQIFGYGLTATSPSGFATVSQFSTGGPPGGSSVIWTSSPLLPQPPVHSPPAPNSKVPAPNPKVPASRKPSGPKDD